MRPYTALWFVWALWVLWIVKALAADYVLVTGIVYLISGGVLALFLRPLWQKGYYCMRLLKRENKPENKANPDTAESRGKNALSQSHGTPALLPPEGPEKMKSTVTRKDTFISSEATLTGHLNGQGNIVIEGRLDGNISSSYQVRIESGGHVAGDIHAQHIVVNGRVEGRLCAEAVTLQSEGHIEGDLVTDVLIIEKGGVFIGQSRLKTEAHPVVPAGTVTQLKISATQDSPAPADVR